MRQHVRILRRSLAVCYPSRAICGLRSVTPPQRTSLAESCHRLPLGEVPEGATFTWAGTLSVEFSLNHFLETSPLRNGGRFWQSAAREDSTSRRRGFLLHTVTRLLRPRLTHYYGIICHLTPLRLPLELPLEAPYRRFPRFAFGGADVVTDDVRLPQLLCWFPVGNHILKHVLPLSTHRASHLFACLPRQAAESGSLALWTTNLLSLPSDLAVGRRRPCESNSLPRGRGEVACCRKRLGLPASLGKQKSRPKGRLSLQTQAADGRLPIASTTRGRVASYHIHSSPAVNP
jgi:hypothetical protein